MSHQRLGPHPRPEIVCVPHGVLRRSLACGRPHLERVQGLATEDRGAPSCQSHGACRRPRMGVGGGVHCARHRHLILHRSHGRGLHRSRLVRRCCAGLEGRGEVPCGSSPRCLGPLGGPLLSCCQYSVQMVERQDGIRGSATLTRIFLPWNDVPERSRAFFSPSTLPNSTYPKPLGLRSSLSSTMRTLVTSHPAKKSVTSPSVASNDRLPKCAVYGGFEGRGRASRVANPRSAAPSLAHCPRPSCRRSTHQNCRHGQHQSHHQIRTWACRLRIQSGRRNLQGR